MQVVCHEEKVFYYTPSHCIRFTIQHRLRYIVSRLILIPERPNSHEPRRKSSVGRPKWRYSDSLHCWKVSMANLDYVHNLISNHSYVVDIRQLFKSRDTIKAVSQKTRLFRESEQRNPSSGHTASTYFSPVTIFVDICTV